MANPTKSARKFMIILTCALFAFSLVQVALAQSTVMTAQASATSPNVGSTLTVTLKISNVQNLFGIDATIQWYPSVLSFSNVALNVGDSNSNGVLHGTINRDGDNIKSGDLYVNETKVSGSYELVAQSFGTTTPSFNGSGTIATLTFNVLSVGSTGLSLQSDLADKAVSGQDSNNITHQDTADSVTAVALETTNTPTSTTLSTPTSNSTSTPAVPEFSSIAILVVLVSLASATIVLAAKRINKKSHQRITLATAQTKKLRTFPFFLENMFQPRSNNVRSSLKSRNG